MFKWKKCEKHPLIKYKEWQCDITPDKEMFIYNTCPLCRMKDWYDELERKFEASREEEKNLFDNNRQLDKHIGIYEDAMCELEEFCDRMFVDKERCEDCLGGCTECDNFRGR